MNLYRVTVSLKMGTSTTFYMKSDCDKIEMLQILSKGREVINILDVDDKLHIYPFNSVNFITID